MEEDIKVLEKQLEQYKRHLENYEKEDCLTATYYQLKQYAEALENLIKGYKDLEEENKELHKEINQRVKVKLENERIVDKDYIPKSKVIEIIEDIDNSQPVIAELKLRKLVEGDK